MSLGVETFSVGWEGHFGQTVGSPVTQARGLDGQRVEEMKRGEGDFDAACVATAKG
ncbi:hypothetical protein [Sneathiella aquimaris]|uniref:hypothetical protein n=1 Tax=Sneathiella aquimaris TaxID=2599305 RepID=UPI00146A5A27|nr:hypothetical protein [Sneathiella aquimaris]